MNEFSGIDISTETLLFFSEASRRLPKNSKGNNVHPITFWRWATKGLKAPGGDMVKLEYVRVGGRNCTSLEALQRFFDRLKGRDVPRILPSTRRKQINRAMEELRRRGYL